MKGVIAHIFEVEGHQVLLRKDKKNGDPVVIVEFGTALGAMQLTMTYADDDSGTQEEKQERAFQKMASGGSTYAQRYASEMWAEVGYPESAE